MKKFFAFIGSFEAAGWSHKAENRDSICNFTNARLKHTIVFRENLENQKG
jgi:hypothetical protein